MERIEYCSEAEYDMRLEHLVDTWNISYDEAREALGKPPYEIAHTPVAEGRFELGTRAIDAVLAEYDLANEAGAAWNQELTPYLLFRPKSVEQMEIDARGRDLVRAAMV